MNYQQPALLGRMPARAVAGGFTLIEMIGVLAIIAILAAAVAPRVFEVIADSRGTRMATEIRAIETGVTRYYGDTGTIQDLNRTTGNPEVDAAPGTDYQETLTSRVALDGTPGTAGAWRRFNGPYLEKFIQGAPAVGTSQVLFVDDAEDSSEDAEADNLAFDLDGAGTTNDTPGDGPEAVVILQVTGADQADFEKVDSIFDEGVAGDKAINGRVKYATTSPTVMTILIAYR
ncbi:MAG: prepilin-type N-terminal cleavage/methylation domain-containing protein [Immundisolibacteraceae bacterium]|nr:prepilin-type N-terminal cleavage/methylation domain-containing protein [Immundisolibacteraceae bacterium]